MKISENSRRMFEFFAACLDEKRLPEIAFAENGCSALECFHVRESTGKILPCREPVLLSRALNGKAWNGLTVTMVAEDMIAGLISRDEISTDYPNHDEIFSRAAQLAVKKIGFVPTFVGGRK